METDILRRLAATAAVALGLAVNAAFIPAARAAEGILLAGPIGGPDIRSALLPPPGLYGVASTLGFWTSGATDNRGREAFPDSDGNSVAVAATALYVYDFSVLGGQLGSSVTLPFVGTCIGLNDFVRECTDGIADVYADLFFWSRFFPSSSFGRQGASLFPIPYGLTVGGGLGLSIPLGWYDKRRFTNPGTNLWDIAPNLAFTYTMPGLFGDATEISSRTFLNLYLENDATDYLTAPILDITFAVSERFGDLQLGLAGDYHFQIGDDESFGRTVPDRRNMTLQLGPVAAWDFLLEGRPWTLSAKAPIIVDSRNTFGFTTIALRLGTRF